MPVSGRARNVLIAALRYLVAIGAFTCLALLFTYPLPGHLNSSVIGAGAGDNLNFVWNFWWAKTASASEWTALRTSRIFAPLGTSLLLHTLTPLLGALAALFLPKTQAVAAYNVWVIASVALNGLCAYAAAYVLTRDRFAALFAGVTFGGAPFLIVRLQGHLNVLSAWGLPLLVLALITFRRNPSRKNGVGVGAALALLGYLDYYALVFGALLLTVYLLLCWWTIDVRARRLSRRRRYMLVGLGATCSVVLGLAVWTHYTGGTQTTIAGIRLSMRETFNLRVVPGFLVFAMGIVWKGPVVSIESAADRQPRTWRVLPWGLVTAILLSSPLLLSAMALWRTDDYVHQEYYWRSAPPGIDVASLMLGNPQSPLLGQVTRHAYERFGINQIESSAWIGIVPLILCVLAVRRLRTLPEVRRWLCVGGAFLTWSLGPYLVIFGHNSGFMLPQTIARFVPIVTNARIPARAFTVVQLVVALLGAMVLASQQKSRRASALALAASFAVLLDYWPARQPLIEPTVLPVYRTLAQLPRGVVLEAPLGIRDGSGEQGQIDPWIPYYQTVHGHDEMGGFVARLSNRVRTSYVSDPIIGPVLEMSEHRQPVLRQEICRDSLACSVRYVVVRNTAPPALHAFLRAAFVFSMIEQSDDRTLYRVDGMRSCSCGRDLAGPSAEHNVKDLVLQTDPSQPLQPIPPKTELSTMMARSTSGK